jgi:hypothetical protein
MIVLYIFVLYRGGFKNNNKKINSQSLKRKFIAKFESRNAALQCCDMLKAFGAQLCGDIDVKVCYFCEQRKCQNIVLYIYIYVCKQS